MRYILSLSHIPHVFDVVFKTVNFYSTIKRLTMIFVLEKSKYEPTRYNFGRI